MCAFLDLYLSEVDSVYCYHSWVMLELLGSQKCILVFHVVLEWLVNYTAEVLVSIQCDCFVSVGTKGTGNLLRVWN